MKLLFENWRKYTKTLQEQQSPGIDFYQLIDMSQPGDRLSLVFKRPVTKGPVTVFKPGKRYNSVVKDPGILVFHEDVNSFLPGGKSTSMSKEKMKATIREKGTESLDMKKSTVTRGKNTAPLATVMANPQVLAAAPVPSPAPEVAPVPEPGTSPRPSPEADGSISMGMGGWYPEGEDPSKEESAEDWSQTTPEEAEAGMSLDPERPEGSDLPVITPSAGVSIPADKMDIQQLKKKHRENTAAMKKAVADTEDIEKWSQLPKDHPARVNFRKTYTQLKKLNWGM